MLSTSNTTLHDTTSNMLLQSIAFGLLIGCCAASGYGLGRFGYAGLREYQLIGINGIMLGYVVGATLCIAVFIVALLAANKRRTISVTHASTTLEPLSVQDNTQPSWYEMQQRELIEREAFRQDYGNTAS